MHLTFAYRKGSLHPGPQASRIKFLSHFALDHLPIRSSISLELRNLSSLKPVSSIVSLSLRGPRYGEQFQRFGKREKCQEAASPHHLGSYRIGSDSWRGLWRKS